MGGKGFFAFIEGFWLKLRVKFVFFIRELGFIDFV